MSGLEYKITIVFDPLTNRITVEPTKMTELEAIGILEKAKLMIHEEGSNK